MPRNTPPELLPEQVRLLSEGLPAATTGNLLIAAIIGRLLWGAVPAVEVHSFC